MTTPATTKTLAILMACHNRRKTTLACLEGLASQQGLPPNLAIRVFLLDDASSDGTAEAVHRRFPEVCLLQGDGQCYWSGGMRLAWEAAAQAGEVVAYFWLNDDTLLVPGALASFWAQHQALNLDTCPGILVGATLVPDSPLISYSGLEFLTPGDPLRLGRLKPDGTLRACVSFNGNAVWIPSTVFRILGGMDPQFRHGLGDWDYGLRAWRKGITPWLMPAAVATCAPHAEAAAWLLKGLALSERFRRILGPKGLPPKAMFTYCRRHGGWRWILLTLRPYLGVLRTHWFS